MKNKNIHIAATIDENYIQHLGVMLCSLFENNLENSLNIYVLIDFKKNIETIKLEKLAYKYNQKIIFFIIDTERVKGLKINGHISKAAYYRLLIPEYVKEHTDKIIYLDCDLIVKQDIWPMWETSLNNYILGAVKEYEFQGIDIFNSGVMMIMVKEWLSENITQKCLDYAINNHEKIIFWDQDVLNEIFKGNWKPLDQKWNVTSNSYNHISNKVIDFSQIGIIHFTGALKPWHFHCENTFKDEYFNYLKKTPWKKFHFKENTFSHHYKQMIKKIINKLTGKKIFQIYA